MHNDPRCGQLLFRSTTHESFSDFVSVETVVISMLFDANLSVPAKFNPTQLPQRVRVKSTTPFSTSVNAKARSLQKPEAQWSPDIPEFSSFSESSAAAIGCKKPGAKKARSPPMSPVPLDKSPDPLSSILETGDSDFRSPSLLSAPKRLRASSQQSDLSNALTTSVQDTLSLEATSSIDDPAVVCSQSTVKRRGRPPRSLRQVILCVTVILVFIFCRFYVKCISRSQEEPSPSTYAHDDAASPPRGRRRRKQALSQP